MINWKEELEKEKAYLDTIDLVPFLRRAETVTKLMDILEMEVGPPDNRLFLFDVMNQEEFIEYLRKRYNDSFDFDEQEIIVTYIMEKNTR